MKNMTLAISTLILAACGTTPSSEVKSANAAAKAPLAAVSLDEGQYLVTFAAEFPCLSGEFNLEASRTVTSKIPTISFRAGGQVRDNLLRPLACHQFPAKSMKTEIVSISTFTHLYAVDMEIVKIEEVKRSAFLRIASLPKHSLDQGRYVLHINSYDTCNAGPRNVVKSLFYSEWSDDFEVRLALGSSVTDELIRPAVCIPGTISASTFIELPRLTDVATPQDNTTFGLEIIQETAKIDLDSLR